MGWFGGWSFFGMHAFWWLFWVVLIVVFFAVILPGARTTRPPSHTPLERLQERYANGEISTEEYEERKRTLERDAVK
jgi:putative membrane protein